MSIKTYDKVAVFDFDHTLCTGNSHLMILRDYYRTGQFESVFMKLYAKLFRERYQAYLDKKISEVPFEYILDYPFPVNKTAAYYLKQKMEQGYYCMIISFAPESITRAVSKQFQIEAIRSLRGKKLQSLEERISYKRLFVCTDNIEDCCLLDKADEKVIFVTKKNRDFFSDKYSDAILVEGQA